MPPASPAATSVLRSASSSEVLPWSTWPMTVTTGGRGCSMLVLVGAALQADLDVGLGDAPTRVAELGDDQLGGVGVDRLVDRRHDAQLISALITSAPRSAMRLASSCTVMVSGMTTSRTTFGLLL